MEAIMANLKIAGVVPRTEFLAAPNKDGVIYPTQAAALIAVTEHKVPRVFIHRMRHKTYRKVFQAAEDISAKGEINPTHWVEINLTAYLANDAVVTVDGGEVIRSGRMTKVTEDLEDVSGVKATHPDLERAAHIRELPNGWTL
jgi:hypothetical protein